ncbi:cold-shock protein [Azospirillum sp. B506]|uniref:cold-shock protein n=1 Tax=Azospirillum sp. B506 TaxID=137721 RepID=UPI00067920E9|nr:cold shock domain-containing protein [Azospirillum sp. B506]
MAQLEGTIRSFVAVKRFGFIDGSDGKSYFFHVNGFAERVDPERIVEGALVTFDPVPTPKGVEARQVRVARDQALYWVRPDRFLFLKETSLKRGRVLVEADAVGVSGKESPDEARAALADLAHSLGATAVLGARYVKGTASSGNYRYTVHGYQGIPAVVMEPMVTTDLKRVEQNEKECGELIYEFQDRYRKYQETLRRERFVRAVLKCVFWGAAAVLVLAFLRR